MLDFIILPNADNNNVKEYDPYSAGEMCCYTGRKVRAPAHKYCSCNIHRNDRPPQRSQQTNYSFHFDVNNNNIKRSDSYETLQIEPPLINPGGEEQVRRAYKKMSLLSHPDKTGGSTEQFIKVNEAYQELLLIC
tara:strand:+ start:460 stop:861 length:402 start_codon:yes stop_codon:yes gene_type:complete